MLETLAQIESNVSMRYSHHFVRSVLYPKSCIVASFCGKDLIH